MHNTRLSDSKSFSTPKSSRTILSKVDVSLLIDAIAYRKLVGSLQYLTLFKLDVSFVVNKLYQFMASLIDSYWFALKRLLRYLKGTIHFGLTFTKPDGLDLVSFYDVDCALFPNDKHNICSILCVYWWLGNLR